MLNQPQNSSSSWMRGTIIAGVLVFAVVLGTTLFDSPAAIAQLQSWKLIPTAQRYTELYFDNNVELPTAVSLKPTAFAFSIHNVEGQNMVYPYTVSLVSVSGQTKSIAKGIVTLPIGETATVPEVVAFPVGFTSSRVVVDLTNQNQSIDFIVGATQ